MSLATRLLGGAEPERTRADPDVLEQRARDQERILDALAEPVVLLTAERRIAFMNAAAGEVFGRELANRHVTRAVRHPDVLDALDAVMAGAKQARRTITLNLPSPVTYRVSVLGLGGELEGSSEPVAVMSFSDVSHVIRAEAMRSDFVANVSHELRSPLTALTGFIETLGGAARDDAEARDRFLAIMAQEAGRMDRLIDDLLSLSKVEAEERVRPTAPLDLRSAVGRVVAMLGPKAEAASKSIAFSPTPGEAMVHGDEDQLVQVFQNLLENAIKYSPPGTPVAVDMSVEAREPGFPGGVVRVEVRDSGEGIAAEHLPRLTERFYRVDTGRSRAMGGTGLGLAIVKHILNRHRGRLTIRSAVGEGSRFTVHLPLRA